MPLTGPLGLRFLSIRALEHPHNTALHSVHSLGLRVGVIGCVLFDAQRVCGALRDSRWSHVAESVWCACASLEINKTGSLCLDHFSASESADLRHEAPPWIVPHLRRTPQKGRQELFRQMFGISLDPMGPRQCSLDISAKLIKCHDQRKFIQNRTYAST